MVLDLAVIHSIQHRKTRFPHHVSVNLKVTHLDALLERCDRVSGAEKEEGDGLEELKRVDLLRELSL